MSDCRSEIAGKCIGDAHIGMSEVGRVYSVFPHLRCGGSSDVANLERVTEGN